MKNQITENDNIKSSTAGIMILKRIAGIFLIWYWLVYLYTLLHEGGHALVGVLYGGRVDNFVLGLNAHVTISGANFTRFGASLFNSAGVLMPAVVLVIALVFYNKNIKTFIYHFIYTIFSIAVISSFFAWLIIPIISFFTAPPPEDDVSKFLVVTGINPLLVSASSLLVMGLLAFLSYKRGLYPKIIEHYRRLKQNKSA